MNKLERLEKDYPEFWKALNDTTEKKARNLQPHLFEEENALASRPGPWTADVARRRRRQLFPGYRESDGPVQPPVAAAEAPHEHANSYVPSFSIQYSNAHYLAVKWMHS